MDENKNKLDKNEVKHTEVKCKELPQYSITTERFITIRKKVDEAIKSKKIFTVRGNSIIRHALIERGWLEKMDSESQRFKKLSIAAQEQPKADRNNLPSEELIISRLLQYHEVDFFWGVRKITDWNERIYSNKILNRFSRTVFTSKEGLCQILQQVHWYTEPGVSSVQFPRCYTINHAEHTSTFIDNFRLTACLSLLKWFLMSIQHRGYINLFCLSGKVSPTCIHFAIDRCVEYLAVQEHDDIDSEPIKILDDEWDCFLKNFHLLIYKGEKFYGESDTRWYKEERTISLTVQKMRVYWPDYDIDGIKNIWIIKPKNKCCGQGIQLVTEINDVLTVIKNRKTYVIQKYIEHPLLIYDTKFDIRQWFLITSVQPLTIWMYRDCYLRFSSRKFNINIFHESIHLTNHAIQHKYVNDNHTNLLPESKMWDSDTFKAYLRETGNGDKWFKAIYPSMRESLIAVMRASQSSMEIRPNTFELFGADFMISENFVPYLIEINASPAMNPTTSVTARMCRQCFEDIIKVVIDYRRNSKADTGLFEQIYKQHIPDVPSYLGMDLCVKGEKLFKKRTNNRQKFQKHISVEKETKNMLRSKSSNIGKNNCEEAINNNSTDDIKNNIKIGDNKNAEKMKKSPATVDTLEIQSTSCNANTEPVTQKATLSLPCRSRINKSIFLNRRSSYSKEGKHRISNRTCTHTGHVARRNEVIQLQQSQPALHKRNPQVQALSLYDKWKNAFEKKFPQIRIESNTWEQDTASILQFKSNLLTPSNDESMSTIFTNRTYMSSVSRILPEIEMKTATSQNLCQNLFNVKMRYKNNFIEPIVKENVMTLNTHSVKAIV